MPPNQLPNTTPEPVVVSTEPQADVKLPPAENPDKSYVIAVIISFFGSFLGIDRFYLGHYFLGAAKLAATLALVGLQQFGGQRLFAGSDNGHYIVWAIGFVFVLLFSLDFLLIALGKVRAYGKRDQPLQGFAQNSRFLKVVAILLFIFSLLGPLASLGFSLFLQNYYS